MNIINMIYAYQELKNSVQKQHHCLFCLKGHLWPTFTCMQQLIYFMHAQSQHCSTTYVCSSRAAPDSPAVWQTRHFWCLPYVAACLFDSVRHRIRFFEKKFKTICEVRTSSIQKSCVCGEVILANKLNFIWNIESFGFS